MRSVINISLPHAMATEVKREVKSGGYGSTSEFFRDLVRKWRVARLAEELKQDRLAFRAGQGKVLRALSDLR